MPGQGLPSLLSLHSSDSPRDAPVTSNDESDENPRPGERGRGHEQVSEVPRHRPNLDGRNPDVMYDLQWDTKDIIAFDPPASPNGEPSPVDPRMLELLRSEIESPTTENGVAHVASGVRQPKTNAPLPERLAYVLESIHRSGFDGPESVISDYYTSDFRLFPRLASSQHLSRNRKLPGILSDLRTSAPSWTEWEAQGYKGEIIRSAESILAAERKKLVASTTLQQFIDKHEKCDGPENGKEDEGLQAAFIIAIFQREVRFLGKRLSRKKNFS
ncbi:hypothetical protein SAPIO_CDS9207 [Scedosporium apiospermum]|uniref:Uncharacterized protein n=1 Tax=Pseudallescheria apiosperma TaxID=563466 RepID=A0A084FYJ6_PSEDA|nr:uncharacterized protein SAPIO_CDS9207 [Scedosporium apiospermum]KEZ40158.1 hypothetical protein SAPIO_CDS9207 [Scedosporium apiospermum]